MQRTGSTFLQQEVYPKIEKINLVNFRKHQGVNYNVLPIKRIEKMVTNIEKYNLKTVTKELRPYVKSGKIKISSMRKVFYYNFKAYIML